MPVGTVISGVSDKLELATCPGGYVIVRRMTYGEELERSALATKVTIGNVGGNSTNFSGEMDVRTDKIAYWDFAHLVVEHNITDANDRPLNFKSEDDVRMLDSTVGKEIGDYIDDFNTAKTSSEVKNS